MGNDGCLYAVPHHSRQVLCFNTRNETTQLVGNDLGPGTRKWLAPALGQDGCIYSLPNTANRILKIDPAHMGIFKESYAIGGITDSPVNKPDRLGYDVYATALAKAVQPVEKPTNSYCVGLIASCGSGKTTLWNEVINALKREQHEKEEAWRQTTGNHEATSKSSDDDTQSDQKLIKGYDNVFMDAFSSLCKIIEKIVNTWPYGQAQYDRLLTYDPYSETEDRERQELNEKIATTAAGLCLLWSIYILLYLIYRLFHFFVLRTFRIITTVNLLTVVQADTELVGDDLTLGGEKWSSGVVAQDGCMYFIPARATRILKFDPASGHTSLVGDDLGDDPWKWRSCVLGRDGCIYGIPYDGQQLLKFNPATETSQLVGGVPEGGKGKWLGAALGFDGYIYGIPHNARCVLKYDPVYNRTKFLNIDGNCGSTLAKWNGFVAADDGCLYGIPHDATRILKIDLKTESTTLVGGVLGKEDLKLGVSIIGKDGCVYGIPYHSKRVLKFDPKEFDCRGENHNTYETYDNNPNEFDAGVTIIDAADHGDKEFKWKGAGIGKEGNIYCIPHNASHVLKIDTSHQKATLVGRAQKSDGGSWSGALTGPDGLIYGIPFNANRIIKIEPGGRVTGMRSIGRICSYFSDLHNTSFAFKENPDNVYLGRRIWGVLSGKIPLLSPDNMASQHPKILLFPMIRTLFLRAVRFVFVIPSKIHTNFSSCLKSERIAPKRKDVKYLFVSFNAWNYSGTEALWASLMDNLWSAIEDEVGFKQVMQHRKSVILSNEKKGNTFEETQKIRDMALYDHYMSTLRAGIILVIGALTLCSVFFLPVVQKRYQILAGSVISTVSIIPAIGIIMEVYTIIRPGLKEFKKIRKISSSKGTSFQYKDFHKTIGFMGEVKKEFEYLIDFLKFYRGNDGRNLRLQVCIDDLDRTGTEITMAVLQAVILFLVDGPITCWLPVDSRIVTASIESHFKGVFDNAGMSGHEYLNKIIQLPFALPNLDDKVKVSYCERVIDADELNVHKVYDRLVKLRGLNEYLQKKLPPLPMYSNMRTENEGLIILADTAKAMNNLQKDQSLKIREISSSLIESIKASLKDRPGSAHKKEKEEFLSALSESTRMIKLEMERQHINIRPEEIPNIRPEKDIAMEEPDIFIVENNIGNKIFTYNLTLSEREVEYGLTASDTDSDTDSEINQEQPSEKVVISSLGYKPMMDEQERSWINMYAHFLDRSPRKMNRIIAVYTVSRHIANTSQKKYPDGQVPKHFLQKLFKFLLLVEQWPFRMALLIKVATDVIQYNKWLKQMKFKEEKYSRDEEQSNQLSSETDQIVSDSFLRLYDICIKDKSDENFKALYNKLSLISVYRSVEVHQSTCILPKSKEYSSMDSDPIVFRRLLCGFLTLSDSCCLGDDVELGLSDLVSLENKLFSLSNYAFNLPGGLTERVDYYNDACPSHEVKVKGFDEIKVKGFDEAKEKFEM